MGFADKPFRNCLRSAESLTDVTSRRQISIYLSKRSELPNYYKGPGNFFTIESDYSMYTMKELCVLYNVGYEGLRNALIATGVFSKDQRKGKGNKPRLAHCELIPFFRKYGDRTGYQGSVIAAYIRK
jgi:hypothetical protein